MAEQQQPQRQEMNVVRPGGLDLPPGFRFHPSDFEIINHYLINKVHNRDFTCIMREVDLNKTEPWDLPIEAKMCEKEWYFFYQKDRKYPTGRRANRATQAGYWKATGKDKEVYKPTEREGVVLLIGMKKTLVFYEGRAPRGYKTNWIMHEYRLEGSGRLPSPASTSSSAANATSAMKASTSAYRDDWVVCRVFHKTTGIKKSTALANQVAMAGTDIDQNQNNIPAIPMPMPMQFPILPDFAMDPVAPYYPNTGVGLPPMMPPMAGISGANRLQINGALFSNPIAALPQMNLYHQMGIGAGAGHIGMGVGAGQIDMAAAGAGGLNVAALESRPPSSMVLQKDDEQANVAEISSMLFVTGQGSATATIEMDDLWKYQY